MKFLICGGAGFIGSAFIRNHFKKNPQDEIINVDNLGIGSNKANLLEVEKNQNYSFVMNDIKNLEMINDIAKKIDVIVNFAAETHVDRSISNARPFIETNVLGTYSLLEATRKNEKLFIHVSTDEIYGDAESSKSFTEHDILRTSNPYSATKASADHLVEAYYRTYGIRCITTRCSNNFGLYQFPEKLIPKTIIRVLKNLKIPLYDGGYQIRSWIYVLDHVQALESIISKGEIGEIYNITAWNEVTNKNLVEKILKIMGKIISFGTKIYRKYPSTQKLLGFLYRNFLTKPTFIGWGMQTNSQLPWIDEYQGKEFCLAAKEFKEKFVFNEKLDIYSKNLDDTLWRHWNISFAINFALKFAKSNEFNLAECGVADGASAFFALKEVQSKFNKIKNYSMHLYDSWEDMRKQDLLESELSSLGRYKNLNMEITKKNLQEFSNHLVFHPGHIPDVFDKPPKNPESLIYLHIDLNAAKATISALEFFFPKFVTGGVIIFDDYGSPGHPDTKKEVDRFFSDKAGILMKSPTGQAIYFNNIC